MRALLAVLLLAAFGSPALAQEARIGLQTETSSIDPHYALVGANQTIAEYIFESLLGADAALRPAPGLAADWHAEGDTGWVFHIRPGATFQDGSRVTADDIRFSIERMGHVPGSPAPFVRLPNSLSGMELRGDDTIVLQTRQYDPSVPLNAMTAWIVSRHAAEGASTADFNSGRAAIGSGPWRFVSWTPGDRLVLERARPDLPFARVTIRPIANDGSREAALLSGDVDLIDNVPTGDLDRLRGDARVKLWSAGSARLIYLALDQEHDVSPGIRAADGSALPHNPLRDVRVRQALSLAINRQAIVERLLHGSGKVAGQLVPAGFVGYDPGIGDPPTDPAQAKRLLAEAGYPDGFRLVLSGPNDRYVADAATAQAVAQMWARIGVATQVDVMPSNVFFSRAAKREFSAFLIGFGSSAGDAYPGMAQVLNTYDAVHGLGALNRERFSDPAFDALLAKSQVERDPAARDALLRQAARLAFVQDAAILPLHFPDNVWATSAGFTYLPAMEEGTLATHLAIAK